MKGQFELAGAFDRMRSLGVEGLVVVPDPVFSSYPAKIAELARIHKVPTLGEGRGFVEAGLVVFSEDYLAMARRSAWYVDQILKGAAPGDLPAEQTRVLRLLVHLKTAKELGIAIPPSVLARADEVVE